MGLPHSDLLIGDCLHVDKGTMWIHMTKNATQSYAGGCHIYRAALVEKCATDRHQQSKGVPN